jgi:hypothetical protein
MQEIKLYNDLYETYISFLIGGTVNDLIKFLKKRHGEKAKYHSWDKELVFGEDADTTDGYQFHINSPQGMEEIFYVWIDKPTPSLVFHETFHLVGDIMNTRCVEYCYESEETFAYLGGWIFTNLMKKIKLCK